MMAEKRNLFFSFLFFSFLFFSFLFFSFLFFSFLFFSFLFFLTWGTRASLVRSWCKGTWASSWPSMTTRPPVGSTMRKRVLIRVDLPQPVRPTMPIFSRGLMLRLKPFSTRSRSSLYRTCSLQHIRWRKEKTTPFSVNLMRSQVLYRAAQYTMEW